jgi:predicted glycoside hydrolase/deacetylase ChbG (UPF0249 family)
MPAHKQLIINGDDFGQSPGITEGIIRARTRGVVTSASLMVRWPAARQAAAYGVATPAFALGLHLDFGEWRCSGTAWTPIYEVVPVENAGAVRFEALSQLDQFRRLLGRDPTHLDSHQHAHRLEPVRTILLELADELHVPLRECSSIHYCGDFYGQGVTGDAWPDRISVNGLIDILRALPTGMHELACHPSSSDDVDSMYRTERQRELETICDPRVRQVLADEDIQLVSFGDVADAFRLSRLMRVQ